jgi:hypothetical protein
MKARSMGWPGNVKCMGVERRGMHTVFWWKRQKGRDHWGDLDLSLRIILTFLIEK